MMKKALLTLLLAFAVISISGQTNTGLIIDWGGIKLEDNIVIGVTFEIDNASLGGLSYDDRVAVDPELATDFGDAVERCVNSANHEMQKRARNSFYDEPQTIFFSSKAGGRKYYLHFIVREVWSSGYTIADAILYTPSGEATFKNLRGVGGVYGTFVNLMGDGFESLGEVVAKEIYKAKKKKKI